MNDILFVVTLCVCCCDQVFGFGGDSAGVTPVPIPNTEVKPCCADGTWTERSWESRSPPDFVSALTLCVAELESTNESVHPSG